jgi:hypothetical protein
MFPLFLASITWIALPNARPFLASLEIRREKQVSFQAAAFAVEMDNLFFHTTPPYMMMVNRSSGRGKPPVCVVRILSVPCFLPACSWRAWISSYPATPRASRTASPIGTNGFPLGVGA